MKNINFILILFSILILFISSCKLKSGISATEFTKQENSNKINGTYLLPQENFDSLNVVYARIQNEFRVNHLVKDKDKEQIRNKKFDTISIFFDGKDKVTFKLLDGNEELKFTYKCKHIDNYLEIYFKKTRIWALPLFMNYQYDRLRLGFNEDSNLINHKWNNSLSTLTIMPFDSFGHSDYRQEFIRLENN